MTSCWSGRAKDGKSDAKGNVVGVTTGRPVMLLDDLLVALRTARAAANGGITCSIDPTPEGIARMNSSCPLDPSRRSADVAGGIENALGMQRISIHGVPETSHFARVLVAADYRMKRLAMDFDPSPVRGLPSYCRWSSRRPRRGHRRDSGWSRSTTALLRDAEGLALELRGSGVKAMTEEDFITADGRCNTAARRAPRRRSGPTS